MADTGTAYRAPARLVHWVMAALILATIPAGFVMVQDGLTRAVQDTLFIFHKNAGVLLGLLVVVRIVVRRLYPPPPLPTSMPPLQARIAAISHTALYALLILMPVTGYVRVRAGGFPIEALDALGVPALVPRSDALAEAAKALHFAGGLAIAALAALHIAAALHHGLIRRDGVFARMWPRGGA